MRLMLVGAGLVFATACVWGTDPADAEVEKGPKELESIEAEAAEAAEAAEDASSRRGTTGGPPAGKAKGR
jgi:type II secretory pathway component PulM